MTTWNKMILVVLAPAGAVVSCGCSLPSGRVGLQMEIQELRLANQRLSRAESEAKEQSTKLTQQVANLQSLGPDRPVAVFAPTRIEIASLSGGSDFDGQPGDDGVTVYLRPVDAVGDVVKAPGRIRVQVLDTSKVGEPNVLAVCSVDDVEQLRKTWYGKFGTSHFTIRCPFTAGSSAPESGKVVVVAEFLDFLSGMMLTATKEVSTKTTSGAAANTP